MSSLHALMRHQDGTFLAINSSLHLIINLSSHGMTRLGFDSRIRLSESNTNAGFFERQEAQIRIRIIIRPMEVDGLVVLVEEFG